MITALIAVLPQHTADVFTNRRPTFRVQYMTPVTRRVNWQPKSVLHL
jgi:hypothetical protein